MGQGEYGEFDLQVVQPMLLPSYRSAIQQKSTLMLSRESIASSAQLNRLLARLRRLFREVVVARKESALLTEELQLAKEASKIAKERYESGLKPKTDWLLLRQEEESVKRWLASTQTKTTSLSMQLERECSCGSIDPVETPQQ